ncbi:hypothetical protein DXG01_007261 [Tephrocybe rancida]|nr:hypothetical protein DXG01_007261 [Tephrocybe rancida]
MRRWIYSLGGPKVNIQPLQRTFGPTFPSNLNTGQTNITEAPRTCDVPYTPLPGELLSKIFSHATEDTLLVYPIDLRSDCRVRWSLRSVCSMWREVALEPSLWSNFTLDWSRFRGSADLVTHYRFFCDHIIHPTATLSFSMIYWPNLDEYHDFADVSYLACVKNCQVIQDFSDRIRTLAIRDGHDMIARFFAMPLLFPVLERLDLSGVSYVPHSSSTTLPNMPALRTLNFNFAGGKALMLPFPWHQLTHLSITKGNSEYTPSLSPSIAIAILAAIGNLVACDLHLYTPHGPWEHIHTDLVYLPHIEYLRLSHYHFEPRQNLLRFLSTPSLLKLKVSMAESTHNMAVADLISFITRSGCASYLRVPKILWMRDHPAIQTDPDLERLLESLLSVEKFVFQNVIFDRETIWAVGSGRILPKAAILGVSVDTQAGVEQVIQAMQQRHAFHSDTDVGGGPMPLTLFAFLPRDVCESMEGQWYADAAQYRVGMNLVHCG